MNPIEEKGLEGKQAYTALYRRWRPQLFSEVVGQEHVTRTLQNALEGGRVAHAYLFCGLRGTGKTTMAKLLAKALNCQEGVKGEPCNRCRFCIEITEGRNVDVQEIDAASNRGIDEIRELREKVRYASAQNRYKVYIIDEVHMLTNEAFNALLKTLEEPPPRVVFILATTETHKLPLTVISRCQRFDFHLLETRQVAQRLREVAEVIEFQVDEESLFLLARQAEGSLRDAMGFLEQCRAYGGEGISHQEVLEILGLASPEAIYRLMESIIQEDIRSGLAEIKEIVFRGRDLHRFLREMLLYLRKLILLQSGEKQEKALEDVPALEPYLLEHRGKMDHRVILEMMEIIQDLTYQLKGASQPHFLFELAFLKLARAYRFRNYLDPAELLTRLEELEEKLLKAGAPGLREISRENEAAEHSDRSLSGPKKQPGKGDSAAEQESSATAAAAEIAATENKTAFPKEKTETESETETETEPETGAGIAGEGPAETPISSLAPSPGESSTPAKTKKPAPDFSDDQGDIIYTSPPPESEGEETAGDEGDDWTATRAEKPALEPGHGSSSLTEQETVETKNPTPAPGEKEPDPPARTDEQPPGQRAEKTPAAQKPGSVDLEKLWSEQVLSGLKKNRKSQAGYLLGYLEWTNARPLSWKEGVFTVGLAPSSGKVLVRRLEDTENREMLSTLLQELLGSPVELRFILHESAEKEKARDSGGLEGERSEGQIEPPGEVAGSAPAQKAQKHRDPAGEESQSDYYIQQIVELFKGQLIQTSGESMDSLEFWTPPSLPPAGSSENGEALL